MSQSSNKQLDMLAKFGQATRNSGASNQELFGDHEQRQAALASLFSSLSSLAASQQQQQRDSVAQNLLQTITASQPSSSINQDLNSMALSSSIQSVVAAAMMQQHLANMGQSPLIETAAPVSAAALGATTTPTSTLAYLKQEQASSSFPYHQDQVQSPTNFSQQPPPTAYDQQPHQQLQQHQQQQSQRINYCTICNKELCNKYFMKTHMLKMHGINLEMEPSSAADDSNGENGDRSRVDSDDDKIAREQACSSASNLDSWSTNGDSKGAQDMTRSKAVKQQTKQNTTAGNFVCKKPISSSKQTTSVMNGFAGNSMGGVVCDICNKELCSKYFLKVHKQNTHGIMTDYQDASQFVYPFPNPLAAAATSNPFLAAPPTSIGLTGPPPIDNNSFPPVPLAFFKQTNNGDDDIERKPKRARLAQDAQIEAFPSGSPPNPIEDLDSAYRLMAQRQQQQSQPLGLSQSMQSALPFDPVAPNPMMMCFGAMNPFGPAGGMSPAMIVDHILRNQHLFNRANAPAAQVIDPKKTIAASKSNKSGAAKTPSVSQCKSKQETGAGNKNNDNNNNNNNRYLTHYTEACPMCDRRFKSIKWLKTHMMNDHKQEIGAYMQMMMQYLYDSNKASQQAAAVASMASMFEQQQQQQRGFHQSPQPQLQQPPPPLPLTLPIPPITANTQQRFQLPKTQQQQPTDDFLAKLLNATAMQQQNKLDKMSSFNLQKLASEAIVRPTKSFDIGEDDNNDDDEQLFRPENLTVDMKSKQLDFDEQQQQEQSRRVEEENDDDNYDDQLDLSLSFSVDKCNRADGRHLDESNASKESLLLATEDSSDSSVAAQRRDDKQTGEAKSDDERDFSCNSQTDGSPLAKHQQQQQQQQQQQRVETSITD